MRRLSLRTRPIVALAAGAALGFAGLAWAQGEPALLGPAAATPALGKAAVAERPVARQRPVVVQAQAFAEKAARGGTDFTVELFDGQAVSVETVHVEQRSESNYTYFGKVRGQPDSEVILTFVDGHLTAEIALGSERGQSKSYRIRSEADAGHWLQELNTGAFPPDHPDGDQTLDAPRLDKLMQGRATEDVALDTGSTIDLLVVYSSQTATAAGTAIGSQIQAAVDRANLAYANSGIAMRVRLVRHAPANYSESGNFSTDLSRLANASDGHADDVHALRNTYGADLVSMFIENSSACGIGYVGPSSSAAFTVVNRGCASSNLSLAHEIGHNLGARHDPYMDASTSPFAYGHGHVNTTYRWRTVMAYNNACAAAGTSCTRIAYFSNPNVSYGTTPAPTGTTSTSNNARVHNEVAYTVANFRQAVAGGTTCTYALSPATATVGASGGTGSTTVTAGSGCAWNAASSASWLTIGSGSGTSGGGTLNYAAAANGGPARSGTISVGGTPFTVSQASGCTYTVSPTSASATAAGGSQSLSVTTSAGCTWSASSGASWMTIASGTSGSGSGSATVTVAANTGAMRTGNLTVAGRTITVTQSAPAAATQSASLTPTSMDFGSLQIGRTSAVTTARYTNTGTAAITISALTLGGTNPADFVPRNACYVGLTLQPGQNCALGYAFAPQAKGTRRASATIASEAGSQAIGLTGDGKASNSGKN